MGARQWILFISCEHRKLFWEFRFPKKRFSNNAFVKLKKNHSLSKIKETLFVTDLSAAGLPAKLKHITQRRKRKQP